MLHAATVTRDAAAEKVREAKALHADAVAALAAYTEQTDAILEPLRRLFA